MTLDLAGLWDFRQPLLTEQRLRAALATATGDDALILQTQIARTHGLRGDFDRAREILASIEPQVHTAGAEARARHALERGRTHASAAHPPESQSDTARSLARAAYEQALGIARQAELDALAIDAIHMLAFVDTAPADQLRWSEAALAVIERSDQPAARRWEGSVRNNIGLALHTLGRFEAALAQFERAVVLRERESNAEATRVAHWMVAWTLRAMQRTSEALAIQLHLEREADAAGAPDPFVFEELELIHREMGDTDKAAHYAGRKQAIAN